MRRIRRRNTSAPRYSWAQIATPIALALVVATGGIGLAFYQTRKESSQVSNAVQEVDTKKEALPPDLDGLLPVTTLQELASGAGGSPVADVALENRSGVLIYAVTLQSGTKLGFDAASGNAVVLQDTEHASLKEQKASLPTNLTMGITFEEAHKLAQDAFPKGKISQIKLNTEGDVVTFSVRFEDDAKVVINAANGNVIRVTTPTGAIAEVPADTPSPAPPVHNPSTADPETPPDKQEPTKGGSAEAPDRSESAKHAPDKGSIQVEGTLVLIDGTYALTEDGTTYIIKTDQDMDKFVDKTVRIDGKLQDDNTIIARNIRLSR